MRKLVLDGILPSVNENLICLFISVTTLVLGVIIFYRKQDNYILYI